MEKIKTIYSQIDFETLVDMSISNTKIVEDKVYGPVYPRMVKKYTIQFEADKLGKEKPEGSEEWEWSELKDYLKKNADKYPKGFNAILYAMAKTEAVLQGKTGVSNRISINEMAKGMEKRLGAKPVSVSDFINAFIQIVDKLAAFKVMPPEASYSSKDEKTVNFVVENCAYKDVCEAFKNENITKYNGTSVCSIGRMIATYLELELSPDYDYILDEFANPNCKVRIIKTD